MTLLDEAAAARVATRVGEIEARTAGEIVVALVPSSADYYGTRALVGLSLAVAVGVLLPWLGAARHALLLELVAGAVGYFASGWPPLLRRLVPSDTVDRAVRQCALASFVERGVHRTRDASGILVFLSEGERAAVVLGDHGIHARIGDAGWQESLKRLLAALAVGEAERGLLQLLDEMGTVLEREFPRREDDANELPDTVVRVER